MDRRVQRLARHISIALAAAATLCLAYLFRHTSCFPAPEPLNLSLAPFPRTSCDVDVLNAAGVTAVTGIDLVDFPPLVRRADPHRLPFPDGAFDLVFSDDPAGFSGALFPSRLAAEAERSVRLGGAIAVAVDRQLDTAVIPALFKRSRVVDTRAVTLDGSQVRLLILQSNGTHHLEPAALLA
jgi:hypothetical protein